MTKETVQRTINQHIQTCLTRIGFVHNKTTIGDACERACGIGICARACAQLHEHKCRYRYRYSWDTLHAVESTDAQAIPKRPTQRIASHRTVSIDGSIADEKNMKSDEKGAVKALK